MSVFITAVLSSILTVAHVATALFKKMRVLFVSVFVIRTLLLGVNNGVPDLWKLPQPSRSSIYHTSILPKFERILVYINVHIYIYIYMRHTTTPQPPKFYQLFQTRISYQLYLRRPRASPQVRCSNSMRCRKSAFGLPVGMCMYIYIYIHMY